MTFKRIFYIFIVLVFGGAAAFAGALAGGFTVRLDTFQNRAISRF